MGSVGKPRRMFTMLKNIVLQGCAMLKNKKSMGFLRGLLSNGVK